MRTVTTWVSTVLLLCLSGFAQAAIISTVNPAVSATVSSSFAILSPTELQIGGFFNYRALLEFDISAETDNASSVTIDFTLGGQDILNNGSVNANLRTGDGIGNASDYANVGSLSASVGYDHAAVMAAGQFRSLDVTSAYNTLAPGITYFGALLSADLSGDGGSAALFLSDITLNITPFTTGGGGNPMPEPSIIALFGVGLLGLGLARRRRGRS